MNQLINKRSFELLIRVADKKGIPEHLLTRGLGLSHADLLSQRGYVTWDQFATYCERFEKLYGGPEELLEIGQYLVDSPSFTSLIQFGGLFTSPKWLYHFISEWFAPMMTPAIKRTSYEQLDPNTIEIKVESPPDLKPCPTIFRIATSMLRYGPTLVGIQPSAVTLTVDGHKATFLVQFSPSMTLLARAKRVLHTTFYGQNVIEELAAQHKDLIKNFENLRRSESNFRLLINNSPDGIVIFSSEKVLFVNPAMLSFLAADNNDQILGKPIDTICHALQSSDFTFDSLATTQYNDSLPFTQVNGETVWAEANTFKATFNGEQAYVCATRDITERKNVLARAIEMDRMISMGILAAGIGHEIRNPLSYLLANITYTQTTVQELCEKIQEADPPNDDQAEWLTELNEIEDAMASALNGTQRIIEISQDLGSFSRNDERPTEPVFIQDAIAAALNIARHEIRHRAGILTQIAVNPAIHTNPTQLSQVILNLLINAAQAIPSGDVENNQITIQTCMNDDSVYVEITDTGSGIPKEIIEHIFTPFFTTKPPGEGTGLGLSISKNIIQDLGGSLNITSNGTQGTRAIIALPMNSPNARQNDNC